MSATPSGGRVGSICHWTSVSSVAGTSCANSPRKSSIMSLIMAASCESGRLGFGADSRHLELRHRLTESLGKLHQRVGRLGLQRDG